MNIARGQDVQRFLNSEKIACQQGSRARARRLGKRSLITTGTGALPRGALPPGILLMLKPQDKTLKINPMPMATAASSFLALEFSAPLLVSICHHAAAVAAAAAGKLPL